MSLGSRLKNAWNVFVHDEELIRPSQTFNSYGEGFYYRPDRPRFTRGNERSIVTSIYNRIGIDVASTTIQHVKLDDNDRFIKVIDSGLNRCLNLEANIDQTGRDFIQDLTMSMLDEGCIAIVPVDTNIDPEHGEPGSFDILSMRVGKILSWYPEYIKASVYNERTGKREDVLLPKNMTAIIQNPLYAVMNEPNSTMQRLIRKLNILDAIDEQSGSGKLDLIIQLPYIIKTEARKQQAENRRKDIEQQLAGSKYGIAYTDGTERITQLNRSVENNIMSQIEFLTRMLYGQLGITEEVMNGTADEKTMLNYYNRTIEPILSTITLEMKRKFLTQTARTQKQSIFFFKDPFKLVPVSQIAEIGDTMIRNEIMSANEVRQILGMKPSQDPKADELYNPNLYSEEENAEEEAMTEEEAQTSLEDIDSLDSELDELESMLDEDEEEMMHYASPYYDPVKAHEYYEEHKKLKGRSLNDSGKAAAKYVRDKLNEEKTQKIKAHREKTDTEIEKLSNVKKSTIEAHKNNMKSRIDSLRNTLSSMSPEQKKVRKQGIQNMINQLREQNAQVRTQLQEKFSSDKKGLNDEHKEERTRLKNEYDDKLKQEMEKINSEKSFQASKKRQRRS